MGPRQGVWGEVGIREYNIRRGKEKSFNLIFLQRQILDKEITNKTEENVVN